METISLPTKTDETLGNPTQVLPPHVPTSISHAPSFPETETNRGSGPETTRNFRALSRDIFRGPSARDCVVDALVIAAVFIAGAWPLAYLVHQLTTMMIRYR